MEHAISALAPLSVQHGSPFGPGGHAPAPPVAPPELVQRFESLMQRLDMPADMQQGHAHVPEGAIARVDDFLRGPMELVGQMDAFDPHGMSLPEMTAMNIQLMGRAATMSMKNEACFAVVHSAKKSVTDLMKNQ